MKVKLVVIIPFSVTVFMDVSYFVFMNCQKNPFEEFVIFVFEFLYPPDIHVGHYEGWKYEVDNCSCKGHVKTADGLFVERNTAPA